MSTRLKKYVSITTCLFFLVVIGCTTKPQGFDRLDTNERGEPRNASTYDAGLDTFDAENLKKPGNTKGLEKAGGEQHHLGVNGAIDVSLSDSSNRAVIYPTVQKPGYNMYSQRAQDSDDNDDHDDDYHDDYHDDDDDDDYYDDDDDDDDDYHDDDYHDDDDDNDDHRPRNRSPVTVGTIPNQTVNVGSSVTVNLGSYFSDPDGDTLTYTATSFYLSRATVSVSGSTLTINGVATGIAQISATATDPGGLTATQTFIVTVNSAQSTNSEKQASLRGDVNDDGVVDIVDMLLVVIQLGVSGTTNADINTDGIVDVQDLILVAAALNGASSAPAADGTLTVVQVQHWLDLAEQQLSLPTQGSVAVRESDYNHGLQVLKQMLRELLPQTMALLPNYPNPFNPETWIPYRLANAGHVQISIYDANGHLVRLLVLGHQARGYYTSKRRAAYWDGRDSLDQTVGSGLYFYQLQAGSESFVRKMLILK